MDTARTLVHAFISSRLDYCNSIMFETTNLVMRKLQAIQNAVARLVTGLSRHKHISAALMDLHWLPVRQRIDYNTLTCFNLNDN